MSNQDVASVSHSSPIESSSKVNESESLSEKEADTSRLSDTEDTDSKRCTSASAAGESEYESVDEGEDDEDVDKAARKIVQSKPQGLDIVVDEDSSTSAVSSLSCQLPSKEIHKNSPDRKSTSPQKVSWADATEEQLEADIKDLSTLKKEEELAKEPEEVVKEASPDDDDDDNYEDVDSEVSDQQEASSDDGGDEEGFDEEEESDEKPLDDDEDKRKPQYIPKRGAFYEHDDRLGDEDDEKVGQVDPSVAGSSQGLPTMEIPSVKPVLTISADQDSIKKITRKEKPTKETKGRNIDSDRWGHDLFNENEQKPKSKEELLSSYGYDIREKKANQTRSKTSQESSPKVRDGKFERRRRPIGDQKRSDKGSTATHRKEPTSEGHNEVPSPRAPIMDANDKIAMRESLQENERRRRQKESDRTSGDRRSDQRGPRRDVRGHRDHQTRVIDNNRKNQEYIRRPNTNQSQAGKSAPFTRDDFPELATPNKETPKNLTVTATSSANVWTRNVREEPPREVPVLKTQVVYSSSRYSNRSRESQNEGQSSSYNGFIKRNERSDRSNQDTRTDKASDKQQPQQQYNRRASREQQPIQSQMKPERRDSQQQYQQRRPSRDYRQQDKSQNHPSPSTSKMQYVPQPRTDYTHHQEQQPISDYSSQHQQAIEDVAATLQKMSMNSNAGSDHFQQHQQPHLSNNRQVSDHNQLQEVVEHRTKRYSTIRQQQPTVTQAEQMVNQHQPPPPPPTQMAIPHPTAYYDTTAAHTPPEYYQDPETTPYTAYAPEAGYHLPPPHRYLPGHPTGHPTSGGPMTVIPGGPPPPTAFIPTFTPSLPPSGFPQYPPPTSYQSFPPPPPGSTGTGPPQATDFRSGITYYDTSQQQPLRSLPPKRPKNIIPIVPPDQHETHGHEIGNLMHDD